MTDAIARRGRVTDAIARRVIVSGSVQGVFFRDSARREARRRGVCGWVRNRADGTVEAHFEGAADGVGAMVLWCREGPRHADVEDVRVREVSHEGMGAFVIR